ncbi:Hypothetical protein ORPV_401 [Orpheovirus IHUMI-LCC2]|uniref:Uncharacterized protein n=1 Tax=Orpheovirus IHUMI-LCC2 TaxID=2023057 RepID=A0A2I2L423_9VIRU|nr:Hypothetical protein ORPV_401 [Orpheovirus IHUMI-LCC2]SNW62305.1 Hypothetical protein ORPV_401 [Orpheovirus IHUMI-LCC2]
MRMDISLELLYYIVSHNPTLYYKLWMANKEIREELDTEYYRKLLICHNIGRKYKEYKRILTFLPTDRLLKLLAVSVHFPSRQLQLGRRDDILKDILVHNTYKKYILDRYLNGKENYYNTISCNHLNLYKLEKILLILYPDPTRIKFYEYFKSKQETLYEIIYTMIHNTNFMHDNDEQTLCLKKIVLLCESLGVSKDLLFQAGYDAGIPGLCVKQDARILYHKNSESLFWRSTTNIINKLTDHGIDKFSSLFVEDVLSFHNIIKYSQCPFYIIHKFHKVLFNIYREESSQYLYSWIYSFCRGYERKDDIISDENILYLGIGYLYRCFRNGTYNLQTIKNLCSSLSNYDINHYKIFYMYLLELYCISSQVLVDLDSNMCCDILDELLSLNIMRYCRLYKNLKEYNDINVKICNNGGTSRKHIIFSLATESYSFLSKSLLSLPELNDD